MKNYIVYFHGSVVIEAENEIQAGDYAYEEFPLAEGKMELSLDKTEKVEELTK